VGRTTYMVGQQMRRFRLIHNMTQEKVAEDLGVQPGHIIAVEKGRKGLSFSKILKACELFNIDITEMLPVKANNDSRLKEQLIADITSGLDNLSIDDLGRLKLIVDAFGK